MAMKIVVLEDNAERVALMRDCVADRFPMYDGHFFDDARDAVRFLDDHLAETLVIALDNDLELKADTDGQLVDPGEGRDVAAFLTTKQPVCPVVVHSTNTDAVEAMQVSLRRAGWKTRRVVPFDDMNWIATDWFATVRRAIVGPITPTKATSAIKRGQSDRT